MAADSSGDALVTTAELKAEFKIKSGTTIREWVRKGFLPSPDYLRQRAVWRRRDVDAAKVLLLTSKRSA